MHYRESANNPRLAVNLDLLEEARERSQIRQAAYRQWVARFFNSNVNYRSFVVGDLVLRKVLQNTKKASEGVLGANWDGPYRFTKVLGGGAYVLKDQERRELAHLWNAEHLRKFYH